MVNNLKEKLQMKNIVSIVIELFWVSLGSALVAVSLQFFLIPWTIAPGGVSGFGITIEKLTGIKVYITNLVINIPLFIFGAKLLGKKSAIYTFIAIIVLSGVLAILPTNIIFTEDLFLASVFGGVIMGLGLGFVFRAGGTTGGTDLAGAIVSHRWKGLSIAKGMAIFDFCIVIFAGIVDSSVNTSLYSLVALFFGTRIADIILDGFTFFKGFFIVSDKPDEVGKSLMNQLERGVTVLNAEGMYSKQNKPVLLCVVSRAQYKRAKEIVLTEDENAFVMITDMKEVYGLGFKTEK